MGNNRKEMLGSMSVLCQNRVLSFFVSDKVLHTGSVTVYYTICLKTLLAVRPTKKLSRKKVLFEERCLSNPCFFLRSRLVAIT